MFQIRNVISNKKQKKESDNMMNQEETKEVKNGDKYNIPMLEKSFELLELLIKYPNGLTRQ